MALRICLSKRRIFQWGHSLGTVKFREVPLTALTIIKHSIQSPDPASANSEHSWLAPLSSVVYQCSCYRRPTEQPAQEAFGCTTNKIKVDRVVDDTEGKTKLCFLRSLWLGCAIFKNVLVTLRMLRMSPIFIPNNCPISGEFFTSSPHKS